MKNKRSKTALSLTYAFLIFVAAVDLIPFFWMILSSFKPLAEIFVFPPKLLPSAWAFSNYRSAWRAGGLNFTRMFGNSMLVALPFTLGCIVTSSLAAFSFARIRFRGSELVFMCLIASMMIPVSVTMIPTFLLFRNLRLIDTLYPLIARGFFGQAFVIFLMRQFYMTLPKELDDAAFVDGYSRLRIWWKIIMPLSKPILATVIIFVFQQVYNDFQNPLIYINSTAKFTVQLGLASFRGLYATRYDLLMAASVFTLVPILALYLSAQKYFVEGIAMTGLKG